MASLQVHRTRRLAGWAKWPKPCDTRTIRVSLVIFVESNFDTVRIVHHSEDGIETERLINMNSEVRELYRKDDEILLFPTKRG